jgi:hypothetical protein
MSRRRLLLLAMGGVALLVVAAWMLQPPRALPPPTAPTLANQLEPISPARFGAKASPSAAVGPPTEDDLTIEDMKNALRPPPRPATTDTPGLIAATLIDAPDALALWRQLADPRTVRDPDTRELACFFRRALGDCIEAARAPRAMPERIPSASLTLLHPPFHERSEADRAYALNFCQPLINARQPRALLTDLPQVLYAEHCVESLVNAVSLEAFNPSDRIGAAELRLALHHPRSPMDLVDAVGRALLRGVEFEGIDWNAFQGELLPTHLSGRERQFAHLLATTLWCDTHRAHCRPNGPLLFLLCYEFPDLYCPIGASLPQIIDGSLTTREQQWLLSARLPAK